MRFSARSTPSGAGGTSEQAAGLEEGVAAVSLGDCKDLLHQYRAAALPQTSPDVVVPIPRDVSGVKFAIRSVVPMNFGATNVLVEELWRKRVAE